MTGTIELDRDGRHLVIRFPYDQFLVDEVKALPDRRWDKNQKCWRVPAKHAELTIEAFMKHGFTVSSDVFSVLAGTTAIAAKPPKVDQAPPEDPARAGTAEPVAGADRGGDAALSVSQLNERVRQALRDAFPGTVQVIGEVVEYDKNQDRRHVFFSLAEKAALGDKVAATVVVAMFERTKERVLARLSRHGLTLQDGIEILVEARVDLYPATGRYQLILEDVRPEFTLGKLALSREQILLKLGELGLLTRNRELPLPRPALRIGVLTSPDSDAWNDFLRELQSSGIGFDVALHPVRVQGEQLRPTMLAGLAWFAARAADFDVLCIVRGGGSRTDLAWFDDLEVATAVARHPVKILCGIGHERDRSVLDEITTSLKTPTAAAAALVDAWLECREDLRHAAIRLREAARGQIELARERLTGSAHRVARGVQARIVAEAQLLGAAGPRAARAVRALLRQREQELAVAVRRTRLAVETRTRDAERTLVRATELLAARSRLRLERAHAQLERAETRQRLLDPRRVLERGYALLRDPASGRIVPGARGLRSGAKLRVQTRDADADVTVDAVRPRTEES
ncbi:MAG: exodeoxyribonuclease VII large subunit [Planctomycetes bacterium]|nr:exodeoxyribonuclease VII large subunit [Planctomycetota bacterium]